ncbi:MAG: Bug family tripartite tricarboxylate transporter substrate binding protein [Burkholderiales bacterium]
MISKSMLQQFCLATAVIALSSVTLAQEPFPNRPMQMLVPFPPGGSADIMGRRYAEKFKEILNEPVVVINRTGANGVVAWQSMGTTKPDGHTLFMAAGQGLGYIHLMNSAVTSRFVQDFTPVASYGNYTLVILVNKELPVTNLRELAAYASKNPKALSYGTTGVGSGGHLKFEMYKSVANIPDASLPPVHFAGVVPELTAIVGNHIQVAIMPLTSLATQQIDAGAIRALAITSENRSPFRKDIATVVEQGFPSLVAKDYLTIWVMSKTPQTIVDKLAAAARRASEDRDIRKAMDDLFFESEFLDGAGARKHFETRTAELEPVIRRLNIKLQ